MVVNDKDKLIDERIAIGTLRQALASGELSAIQRVKVAEKLFRMARELESDIRYED